MKKALILVLASSFLLFSCGGNDSPASEELSSSSESSLVSSEAPVTTWTITFNSNGGSSVASQKVKDGGKAAKPADPGKANAKFLGWCSDSYCTTIFDFSIAIHANWTLYASWEETTVSSSAASSSLTSSSVIEESGDPVALSSSEADIDYCHGPEGSALASWYLVGEGSLWADASIGWKPEGGVQFYTNPANLEDKGCLLCVLFEVGDKFKVTDESKDAWFGYEKVDKSDDGKAKNKGTTCFEGVDDNNGGLNIRCTVAGVYDVYVASSGSLWIQSSDI
jgi:hypothetical protein